MTKSKSKPRVTKPVAKVKRNLSALTIRRLRAVKNAILAEPALYAQNSMECPRGNRECGSAACIFGWATILFLPVLPFPERYDSWRDGSRALGFRIARRDTWMSSDRKDNTRPGLAASLLYFAWPHSFRSDYDRLPLGSMAAAKVAAARIEHFIKTDGAE